MGSNQGRNYRCQSHRSTKEESADIKPYLELPKQQEDGKAKSREKQPGIKRQLIAPFFCNHSQQDFRKDISSHGKGSDSGSCHQCHTGRLTKGNEMAVVLGDPVGDCGNDHTADKQQNRMRLSGWLYAVRRGSL